MGNHKSCCLTSKSDGRELITADKYLGSEDDEQSNTSYRVTGDVPSRAVQHIQDREDLDDQSVDPSNNPKAQPFFMSRSKSDLRRSERHQRKNYYENSLTVTPDHERSSLRKSNSCSTIFIDDSTVSQPNLRNTIKAVALAIYLHIKNRQRRGPHQRGLANGFSNGCYENEERALQIFDESLHPLSKDPIPDDYFLRDPDHRSIYRFMRTLFSAAQLTAECAIVTLVYLERLMTYAELELCPYNWRRLVLGAILLASKVWDDMAVWNVDFCQILKDITVEDMNDLEREVLQMLQFNINVPSSVYAKYYFDLRTLADEHELGLPLEPMSKEKALKLEAMSYVCQDKIKETLKLQLTRTQSLDGMSPNTRLHRAVLS